jgi:hypothetical protein
MNNELKNIIISWVVTWIIIGWISLYWEEIKGKVNEYRLALKSQRERERKEKEVVV